MKALSKTLTSGNFDEVFIEVPHEEKLGLVNSEQLRLFHLNVVDKAFSLKELQSFLRKNIGQYVFSRMRIEEYELSGDAYSVGLDAIELMRKNGNADEKGTGNELGEILLYAFLEYSSYLSYIGGKSTKSGHFRFASKIASAVLTPYFLASSFLARMIPWRFSLSPQTATGRSFRVGLNKRETDAKKLFKSQCKTILSPMPFTPNICSVFILHPLKQKVKRKLLHFEFI